DSCYREGWRRDAGCRGLPGWLLARPELRDTLSAVRCIGVALPVEPVIQWHVFLVAFTHLYRWGAFARTSLARQVARATHVEHRVLGHPAVKVTFRDIGVVLETGGPLLRGRQESRCACWWPVQIQVEAQVSASVVLLGVLV